MEWTNSPIVYREAAEWAQVREVARRFFSEKSALCHYYGTANKTLKAFLMSDRIRYKKYFYALRPLLCCRWIERFHEAPPMEFGKLLLLFEESEAGADGLDGELLAAIRELLDRKAVTEEKDLNPQMPVIIDFITAECGRQKAISDRAADDRRHDFSELNETFRRVLGV